MNAKLWVHYKTFDTLVGLILVFDYFRTKKYSCKFSYKCIFKNFRIGSIITDSQRTLNLPYLDLLNYAFSQKFTRDTFLFVIKKINNGTKKKKKFHNEPPNVWQLMVGGRYFIEKKIIFKKKKSLNLCLNMVFFIERRNGHKYYCFHTKKSNFVVTIYGWVRLLWRMNL